MVYKTHKGAPKLGKGGLGEGWLGGGVALGQGFYFIAYSLSFTSVNPWKQKKELMLFPLSRLFLGSVSRATSSRSSRLSL